MSAIDEPLAATIRELALPAVIATIATEGGTAVHPALRFRAQSVHPAAWSLVERSPGLVPLWSCGIDSAFADADGTFVMWSVEEARPSHRFPDYAGLVRSLLTELREDDEDEDDLRVIAGLLLPGRRLGGAQTRR
ncbi:hypothetical protein K0817_007580 [Microbacterium sp. HD4P20]|uniref:hypothetical protein n=1 Tax=Microbacterium sp. HD4P20 TaxID=2864874 RepID=UPI001C64425F|nr:hypothetical protein [Microbacterium sp. HD4P20]MCP2636430.1 hypothetical protein [Microbacterium sp. HD4P20]